MSHWCLGFAFTLDPLRVVLLKKGKSLHVGLWNGLGGKVEQGRGSSQERAIDAMTREFQEEAGIGSPAWDYVGALWGRNREWVVSIYTADLPLGTGLDEITADYADKVEADKAVLVPIDEVTHLNCAPHTSVMMYMALDRLRYKDRAGYIDIQEIK